MILAKSNTINQKQSFQIYMNQHDTTGWRLFFLNLKHFYMKIKLQYTILLLVILLSVLDCKAQFTGVEASFTPASVVGFGDSYNDITFKSGISIGVFKWKTAGGFYTFNYEYNSLSKSYSSSVENISVLVNFQEDNLP